MMRTNDFPSVPLTERNDHDQEPLVVPEGIDRVWQIEPAGAAVTRRVRGKKRKRQEECTDDLRELRV